MASSEGGGGGGSVSGLMGIRGVASFQSVGMYPVLSEGVKGLAT